MSGSIRSISVLATVVACAGCMPGGISMEAARGEPAAGATITLTVNGDRYEIDRWYSRETWHGEAVVVPRGAAAGCESARFFLNDGGQELRVAEPAQPGRLVADRLPLPGPTLPPCSLLVSYGSFKGPPPLEGLFVTGPGGTVAGAPREPSHAGYYALAPFEAVGEVWLFAGAILATPVIVPGGMIYGHEVSERTKKERAQAEAGLPPRVAECWKAAEKAAEEAVSESRRFRSFTWPATRPGSFVLAPDAVTLLGGRVAFDDAGPTLWTDAEFDCSASGDVRLRLRR